MRLLGIGQIDGEDGLLDVTGEKTSTQHVRQESV